VKSNNVELHPSGLNIIQNSDGSYCFEWNPTDPRWNWMNNLTDAQIQNIIEKHASMDLKNDT
jgi:hypothetical protein